MTSLEFPTLGPNRNRGISWRNSVSTSEWEFVWNKRFAINIVLIFIASLTLRTWCPCVELHDSQFHHWVNSLVIICSVNARSLVRLLRKHNIEYFYVTWLIHAMPSIRMVWIYIFMAFAHSFGPNWICIWLNDMTVERNERQSSFSSNKMRQLFDCQKKIVWQR